MASRWLRMLKHRWFDDRLGPQVLGPAAMQRLAAKVADSERRHSGEIRVCIEAGLPLSYLWCNATARDRALAMFGKLRIWDTEHNNGVLIYLLLADHSIELIADRGLNRHVDAAQWAAIAASMRAAFQGGQIEQGLMAAIDRIDGLLARHFPLRPGEVNENELPDEPAVH